MDDGKKVLAHLSGAAGNLVDALAVATGFDHAPTGEPRVRVVLSPEAFDALWLKLQEVIYLSNRKASLTNGWFGLHGVRFEREGGPA